MGSRLPRITLLVPVSTHRVSFDLGRLDVTERGGLESVGDRRRDPILVPGVTDVPIGSVSYGVP